MEISVGQMMRRPAGFARRLVSGLALLAIVTIGPVVAASAQTPQPPDTPAARDGFLPLDESQVQERLPATPIVATAYSVAWLVIFTYVWSLWSRLSRVERDIADVSRRIEAGARR
jgi:CcmD family protein